MIKPKKGFTLIEILVVMTIIGILAGLSLTASMGAKKSSRDGKRKADLEQIRSALEMYRVDRNTYVSTATACDSSIGACGTCPCSPAGSDWAGNLESVLEAPPGYISDLPTDPLNNSTYYYYYRVVCNGTGTVCGVSKTCTGAGNCCAYELGARRLETTSDWYLVCNP